MEQTAREFQRTFFNRPDIEINFTEEAIDHLVAKVWEKGADPVLFLKQSFQNYEHGLRLIKERTGRREFLIPAEGVENPEYYLNILIRETYKRE